MTDASQRPFVITAYLPGPDGELRAQMPSAGPCADRDERPCRLGVHHRRPRCTGPCFSLTVARCRAHQSAFTLYPPGHLPYGRLALAPSAPDGSAIRVPPPQPLEAYRATLFEPALDAAAGLAWRRQHPGASSRWWPTQHRRLALATHILGIAPALDARRREQVAELLGVDTLRLHEAAARLRQAPGYRARGEAVCRVLEALPAGRFVTERLLECTALAGLCGAPLRWLPETRTLRRRPFRSAATHRAPRPP